MLRQGLWLAVAGLLACLSACDSGGAGPECIYDTDCESGLCRNGECVEPGCVGGCGAGTYCLGSQCTACDVADHCGAECVDCLAGESGRACVQGRCGCLRVADCAAGEDCQQAHCVTQDCESRLCPGLDWVCVEERCTGVACLDIECPAGLGCVDGQCYPQDCTAFNCTGYAEVCVEDACVQETCVGVQCPGGYACANGNCYPADCQQACGPEEVCLDGNCVPTGCAGLNCPEGTVCEAGECLTCDQATRCGPECVDCSAQANDRACVDGECGCFSDSDCEAAADCQSGQCTGCQSDCAGKCGGADDGCGGNCQAACPSGQWCEVGACVACEADQHCGPSCANCTDPSVPGDHCSASDPPRCACRDNAGCPAGERCVGAPDGSCAECDVAGACGPSCLNCAAQATNQACVDGDCGCESDEDCTAGDTCDQGKCSGCAPACAGKCGGAPDGCGGSCTATCPSGQWCQSQSCTPCADDQHCGPGCVSCSAQPSNQACLNGTSCGCRDDVDCGELEWCDGDACRVCTPSCAGKCGGASDGCGGSCTAACPDHQWCSGQVCTDCTTATHCGLDGAIALCEDCAAQSTNNACVYSTPLEAYLCGCHEDSDCATGEWCTDSTCCVPQCAGKCGGAPNGCGGVCIAACPEHQWCSGQVCTDCTVANHCGLDEAIALCVDCTAQATNHACVYSTPLEAYHCGCTSSADCASGGACTAGQCPAGQPEDCDNGVDDDFDGLTDCADIPACPEFSRCGGSMQRCEDGACVFCSLECEVHHDCTNCGSFIYCNNEGSAGCCASCPTCPCP